MLRTGDGCMTLLPRPARRQNRQRKSIVTCCVSACIVTFLILHGILHGQLRDLHEHPSSVVDVVGAPIEIIVIKLNQLALC